MLVYSIILLLLITLFIRWNNHSESMQNKKKCLIIFYGLPRTIEKTSENFYKNIIEPNKDKYEFTIIINTSYDDTEYLNKIYKCKTVINENYNDKNVTSYPIYRLYTPLTQEVENHYDMYIYSRMDIVLNKEIILENYNNSLCIVEGNFERDDLFHNRDWDYMWIGNEFPFKMWCYYLLKYNENLILQDSLFTYKNLKMEYSQFLKLKNKIKLIDKSNKITIYHNIINEILSNGYNVELSSNKDIFATIIR